MLVYTSFNIVLCTVDSLAVPYLMFAFTFCIYTNISIVYIDSLFILCTFYFNFNVF